MKKTLWLLAVVTVLATLSGALFGCGQTARKDTKGKITLGYMQWDTEIASIHVIKQILQDAGFEVEVLTMDAEQMWTGIGQGSIDASISAWLPGTYADYYAAVKDRVNNLGPNLNGAKIGLVVPTYVDIDSIEQFNEVKDQFKGQLTGIETGTGIMKATENAIAEYGLDYELKASSSAAMAASLKHAIDNREWIAVTSWTPHWRFAQWDLKYLDDPKGVYGGEEHIATITRKGFAEEMPEAYQILDNFYWKPADMETVMLAVQGGLTPEEAAAQWVAENQDKVATWLP